MRIKYISLAALLFLSIGAVAQHNEEVTIEGTYRPKVNKVDKIVLQPETPQQKFEMPGAEVNVKEIEHRFSYQLETLSPQLYSGKNAQMPMPAKNFLMAGLGSRISPVFLYKHNSKLSKTLGLGVGIKHYSSWWGIKDYAPSSFMNNAFDMGLSSSKFSNLQVSGNVYYWNDMIHYYGVKMADLPASFDVDQVAPKQVYNTVGGHFGMVSTTTRNGEFVHDLGLDYHYLFGKVGDGREHHAALNYDLGYVDSWWGKKNHPQKLGVAMGVQYGSNGFTGQMDDDRLIFKVNPYFEMKDDFYRLHLGVRMDGATTTSSFLSVHPDLKGSLFVLNNTLEFYAGLNGGRKMFTYSDMVRENPFVGSGLKMEVSTVKLGFEGGIRTNLMKTVDLHAGVRYRHTTNDPFYVVYGQMYGDYAANNMFDVVYDETHVVSVLADVRWLALDKVTVDAGATYNKYQLAVLDRALYRPEFEARLKVNYDPTQSLSLYSSFLFQGGRYALTQTPLATASSVKLKPVMDLGLGADYRVRDELVVFAKVNNLLHQKYILYYNYPVSGVEFFAGVKMTF